MTFSANRYYLLITLNDTIKMSELKNSSQLAADLSSRIKETPTHDLLSSLLLITSDEFKDSKSEFVEVILTPGILSKRKEGDELDFSMNVSVGKKWTEKSTVVDESLPCWLMHNASPGYVCIGNVVSSEREAVLKRISAWGKVDGHGGMAIRKIGMFENQDKSVSLILEMVSENDFPK